MNVFNREAIIAIFKFWGYSLAWLMTRALEARGRRFESCQSHYAHSPRGNKIPEAQRREKSIIREFLLGRDISGVYCNGSIRSLISS